MINISYCYLLKIIFLNEKSYKLNPDGFHPRTELLQMPHHPLMFEC